MTQTLKRLFGEPYRVFFMAAGLYAVFALLVWEIWLGVHTAGGMVNDMPFAAAPHLWHAHEMIFGYASAALGGFFLTAVPNWTGARAAAQVFVTVTALIWLAGRLAIWYSGALPPVAVAVVDLAFLPLLGVKIALMLIKRPKPQNVAFLAVLALVWSGNLLVHLEWLGLTQDTLYTGLRTGLFALCLMIAVLGGRVTPAFTRNAMKRTGVPEDNLPQSFKPLDVTAIVMIALATLSLLVMAPEKITGALTLIGGVAQIARIRFWGVLWTLGQPILWALHLGMAMLGAGMILWGASAFGWGSEVAALHVLGIGAVGGMTLAVMSRAVLGHSGRALVAPGPVALAYGFIALAAVLRWLASSLSGDLYFPMMLVTGALWIFAFTLYLAALWPAFVGPRKAGEA
ncbi:NnrS family protein [Roseovarius sp. A21]|uniref:NnrS family protein n=1 Tax=Roseovarius bejariae TaxID=2576383 RepID=A0A844CXD6_9RHOB|nr:NnrS family protein [Roseovarius bejariae]MRU15786.1 NnrS family protein [Roseovarius bejariae]